MSHQFLHQAVLLADKDAAGDRQVAVEPRVPQAASIRLHVHRQEPSLDSLGVGFELQARAASHTNLKVGHLEAKYMRYAACLGMRSDRHACACQ